VPEEFAEFCATMIRRYAVPSLLSPQPSLATAQG
jgi:hypothetical protein